MRAIVCIHLYIREDICGYITQTLEPTLTLTSSPRAKSEPATRRKCGVEPVCIRKCLSTHTGKYILPSIFPSMCACMHACMNTSGQTNAHSILADYEFMLTNEFMLPKNALAASARLREEDREISNIGPWRAALEDDGTLSVDTFPPPPSPSLGGGEGRTDTHKHMLICMRALLHIRKISNRSPSH